MLERFKTSDESVITTTRRSKLRKLLRQYGEKSVKLGTGSSGEVWKFSQPVAVKMCRGEDRHEHESRSNYADRIIAEYKLLQQFEHVNIIEPIKCIHLTKSHDEIYQVYELCEIDLYRLVKKGVDFDCKMEYFRQALCGVKYLHDSGFSHRDLKLSNFAIKSNGVLKIIDFGACCPYMTNGRRVACVGVRGTCQYTSPEMFRSVKYEGDFSDVWSMGIVLFYLCNERFPWKEARLCDKDYMRFLEDKSLWLNSLLKHHADVWGSMCQADVRQRTSITEVLRQWESEYSG